jgi:hypothetical protein
MSKAYIPRADFVELEGVDSLTVYRFGDRTVNHYFCGTCGIYPFHEIIRKPGQYRVNLLCLEDLDPLTLEVDWVDGRAF